MSRKANCRDNVPTGGSFSALKTELVHWRDYPQNGISDALRQLI
jgi:hypothetical protein